jgi:hypothetical protein
MVQRAAQAEEIAAKQALSWVVSLLTRGPLTVSQLEARIARLAALAADEAVASGTASADSSTLTKEDRKLLQRRLRTALYSLETRQLLLAHIKDDQLYFFLSGVAEGVSLCPIPDDIDQVDVAPQQSIRVSTAPVATAADDHNAASSEPAAAVDTGTDAGEGERGAEAHGASEEDAAQEPGEGEGAAGAGLFSRGWRKWWWDGIKKITS